MEVDNPGFSLRRYNINCCRILFKVLLSHKTLAGTFWDFYSGTDVRSDFLIRTSNKGLLTIAFQTQYYTTLIGTVTNQEPRKTIGYFFENNRLLFSKSKMAS